LTNITKKAGWMPAVVEGSDFSAAGLTVGRIGASAGLESSPETRIFSSPIIATDVKRQRSYYRRREKFAIAIKDRVSKQRRVCDRSVDVKRRKVEALRL
jgi:hypothetical protein